MSGISSGAFRLTWQAELERAEAAYRSIMELLMSRSRIQRVASSAYSFKTAEIKTSIDAFAKTIEKVQQRNAEEEKSLTAGLKSRITKG